MHVASPTHETRTIKFAQSSAVTSAPSVAVVSSKAWVALNESLADADNVYAYDCTLKNAAKATGEAWAIGQALYWSTGNSNFTTTSTSNTACGYAGSVEASGATTGTVLFRSMP